MAGGAVTKAGLALFRTLDAAEIDAVIAQTLAREALAAVQARRAAWQRTVENAASFATSFAS
jgi:hypothetical protein